MNPPSAVSEIPYPTTPLFGRAAEMAALHGLVERDRVRLVTLTGAGGSGKSRLAAELAMELSSRFDRAWFVDLSAIGAADLVPSAVAQAIGVNEAPGAELDAIVHEMLSIGRFLLIMDNFEHVLEGGTHAARLLSASPHLVILATSREALRVRPEHIFPVEPLSTPGRDQLDNLDLLRTCASIQLFEDRARAAQPAFQLTDNVLPTVAEICLDLDGLPLAIELVAAQASVLTPREILERLGDRAPLVTSGPRDLPARHRTLDATVGWTYDLLTPAQQTMFRRCGVFVGGFTHTAISTMQSGTPLKPDALQTLSQLVAKSLVRVAQHADRPSRFSLLDTIRAYAMDRLLEAGELQAAQCEHARYYVEYAERLQGLLRGPGMADAIDTLEAEYANFRAVFQWSTTPDGEIELGLRLAGALYRFWLARGHVAEARAWLESALERSDNVAPAIRAIAFNAAGVLAGVQHDHERAIAHFERSLTLWNELGELARQARVALNLGIVAQNIGQLDTAEQRFEQGYALYARNGDRPGQADALGSRAAVARDRGDFRRATDLFEESLGLFRDLGDQWGVANVLANLGHVRLALDDRVGARDALRESLKLRQELGNVRHIAESLEGLAAVLGADEPRLAVRLLGAAELIRETSGAPVPAVEQARYAEIVGRARSGLTATMFRAAWNAGRALSVSTAIEIAMGLKAAPPEMLVEPLRRETPVVAPPSSLDALSARERDIALLIAQGYSNQAIADELVVSVKTVETHVKHIFAKLNVRNRAGVASVASRAQPA